MAARNSRGNQNTSGKVRRAAPEPVRNGGRAASILLFGVSIFLFALTYIPGASSWETMRAQYFRLLGVIAYPAFLLVFLMAYLVATGHGFVAKLWQGTVLLLFSSAFALLYSGLIVQAESLTDLVEVLANSGEKHIGGGILSLPIGWPLLKYCGRPAGNVIILVLVIVFIMLLTDTTVAEVVRFIRSRFSIISERRREIAEEREEYDRKQQEAYEKAAAEIDSRTEASQDPVTARNPENAEKQRLHASRNPIDIPIDIPIGEPAAEPKITGPDDYGSAPPPPGINMSEPFHPAESAGTTAVTENPVPADTVPPVSAVPDTAAKSAEQHAPDIEQIILRAAWDKTPTEKKPVPVFDKDGQGLLSSLAGNKKIYSRPPLSLYDNKKDVSRQDYAAEMKRNADLVVHTLASFGVQTHLTDICRGPSVTRYELQPEAGIKISKITNLADDLAMNLAAEGGVRIEAPIPGKAAVGIEVPNKIRSIVSIYSIFNSEEYRSSKAPIVIPLGKDIDGSIRVFDLTQMPHLLIAGTTGSGKSVCTNSIIQSIIYRSSPDEVRMILIDPKTVEFQAYNGIPHLIMPVVTDPRKSSAALGCAVAEMERRYKLFAENNARDIRSYNKLSTQNPELEKLPYIVIIIDEFADLMMTSPKDVEDYVCRLAQKARAAGMHLIIATQTPRVDFITGRIKANIPSRIALKTANQVDSRVIMDSAGAEKLLTHGDMLFIPTGSNKPIRIQGAFVSDSEITSAIDFIKENGEESYDGGMIEEMNKLAEQQDKKGTSAEDGSGDYDDMLKDAIETVIDANMASTSLLQRKLKLGYARAARIMDQMEELHVVGPFEGAKPRTVLITKQQFYEMFNNGALGSGEK